MAKLFIDLDGVLADFDRGVERVTGKRPEQLGELRRLGFADRPPAPVLPKRRAARARR
jgi:hypothetical protein